MGMTPEDVAITLPSTSALGDWYANILFTRPEQIVLCVSEKSRLCVLITAKDADTIAQRIEDAIIEILREIGVADSQIQSEKARMAPLAYGATTDAPAMRSVIGSMTEYTKNLDFFLEAEELTLPEIARKMSDMICGPLQYARPTEAAKKLLAEA
ncbi:hypothetical protein CCAX7_28210 [Capsulimonas corticalis]|uniref:DUF6933 domain-containing protein n=2 Tax=Capsulimonas corticalis TaxID=2219043 RepID=A0A402CTD5_9BACT|nr:hypothetical protein CCAX7_28210 [Capsulimonas corticalis]